MRKCDREGGAVIKLVRYKNLKMRVDLKHLLSPGKFVPVFLERKNSDHGKLGPFSVELHWTSRCNYKCLHCSYGIRREKNATLSNETIQALLDDLIELKPASVYLSGGGEPTMISGWHRHAGTLMDNNIEVALITNGVNIKDKHLDVVRKLNYIAVSIYSTDEDEYNRITGGGFFAKQFALPGAIKESGNNAVVGARSVLNRINYKSLASIYKKAIASGYDYVIFIPAVDYEGRGIEIGRKELDSVKKIISGNYDKFDFAKTNLDSVLKRNISHYESYDYRNDFISPPVNCSALEIRGNAFVNYDGGVYTCQPHIGNEEYCLGNINEKRFRKIWNSARHRAVIKKLNRNFISGLCRNCRSIGFNKKADEYENSGAGVFEIVKDRFI